MTIGEKIAKLRMAAGYSQEYLAEQMNVSRQSVSKWEMGQSLPQIDKLVLLCQLFSVSADSLLQNEIPLQRGITVTGFLYSILKRRMRSNNAASNSCLSSSSR